MIKLKVNVMGFDSEAAYKEARRVQNLMNVKQAMVNTVAGRAVFDAREALKKTRLWRHDVKHDMNLAYESYAKYERVHTSDFGDRYKAFLDYLDNVEEAIQPHVDVLKMTAWQVMTRHGLDLGETRAKVMAARVLTGLSVRAFDILMDDTKKKIGVDLTEWFLPARLARVEHLVKKVTDTVCLTANPEVDKEFAHNEQVTLAMRVIVNKYADWNFVNAMLEKVVEQNPELAKYCDGELKD